MQARTQAMNFANYQATRVSPLGHLGALCTAFALLSLGITVAAVWLGAMILDSGHSASATEREIVIGNDVFVVPENAIRFEEARRDGVQPRLDLYLRWPELEGYTAEAEEAFNNSDGAKSIIFLTLEPRMLSRDMSGRLEPIYRGLLQAEPADGPAGLKLYRFREDSGYAGELLAVGERPGNAPFVARCLAGEIARTALASCDRDIFISAETTLSYRFPEALLSEWQALDAAIWGKTTAFLQGEG
ncbi:hypothetical protein [Chelativorans sp.]|uniref:hypothetical protein n=1 Tax=Chelativorans sp. TaxID=2203393 RepID=UPI0028125E09|nr:hypothetical protein [Chelativorans sp.]